MTSNADTEIGYISESTKLTPLLNKLGSVLSIGRYTLMGTYPKDKY